MMGNSAPFSELSPESLIVQSSRWSPTGGKLASPCFREACLSCETFESRHAVRRSLRRFQWNRWKCGCRSRSRLLGSSIGMSDRSSRRSGNPSLLRSKKGANWVSSQWWEALILRRTLLMMAIGGKAYAWRSTQGCRNSSTYFALDSHAGAENTESLAVSEAWKRLWSPATGEEDPGPPVGVVSTRILSPGWAD